MKAMFSCFVACGLLLLLVAGCIPDKSDLIEEIQINTLTPAPTIIPTSTLAISPSTNQSLIFYSPKIERRCTENREVSFNKLGVSKNSMVVLSDLAQTGLWTYSVEDSSPKLLQTVPLNTWVSYSLNSTGEYLAFTIGNLDGSSSSWLLSLISKEQSEISKFENMDGAFPYIKWLSKDELLVGVSCSGPGCPFPIKVINVVSGSEVNVSEDESGVADYCISFFSDNKDYLVLYSTYVDDGYIQFYGYDYSNKRKILIFPWLDERVFFYPLVGTNFGLIETGDYLAMYVEQSYGYDAGVVSADINEMTQDLSYDSLMKRVFTQITFGDIDYSFIVMNPANKDLLMSMSFVDYANSALNSDLTTVPKYVESVLFAVDLENPIEDERADYISYVDYCFVTTGYSSRGFSPDGRIMTFSSDDEFVLLNLETGEISRLSGWNYIGWSTSQ